METSQILLIQIWIGFLIICRQQNFYRYLLINLLIDVMDIYSKLKLKLKNLRVFLMIFELLQNQNFRKYQMKLQTMTVNLVLEEYLMK